MAEDPSADAPPAMSDAQAETLRGVVANLRRCLPDPSARDVHDAIAENDPEMAAWATAGRVKKLCTKMNKELRRSPDGAFGPNRRGDEPDETGGPVVVEALSRWPTRQSPIFLHVAARGDSRVFFPHEHHERVEGEDGVSVGVAFRRSVAEAARLFDERVALWRLISDSHPIDSHELVVVCEAAKALMARGADDGGARREEDETRDARAPTLLPGSARCVFEVAFTFGDAGTNAHKRLLTKPLAENAGAIGEIRLSRDARDVWLTHLRRNRHYEDKYSETAGGAFGRAWWEERVLNATAPAREVGARRRSQTWETSYVVTPKAEWFR